MKGPGVHHMLLPVDVKGRVALPDGKIIEPDLLRVIVDSKGKIKTAYPVKFF